MTLGVNAEKLRLVVIDIIIYAGTVACTWTIGYPLFFLFGSFIANVVVEIDICLVLAVEAGLPYHSLNAFQLTAA